MIGILAFGRYYRYWALNLAASIKYHSPNAGIHLICDTLEGIRESFFDKVSFLEEKDYIQKTRKGDKFFPCLAKLSLDKYIEEPTLFIDADSLVLKDIQPVFQRFTKFYHSEVQGYGKKGQDFRKMLWATTDEAIEHFGLSDDARIPALNTSFQYLKPGKELTELYELARHFLLEKPFDTRNSEQKWGRGESGEGNHPDELYMDMALAKLNLKADFPAILHFPFKNANAIGEKMLKNKKEILNHGYYGLSFAGDGFNMDGKAVQLYDGEMKRYMGHFSKGHSYYASKLLSKKFIRLN